MALVKPRIDGDRLTVSAPDMEPISIDLSPDGKPIDITIWRDTCQAVDQGEPIAEWFSTYIGSPCRIVAMAPNYMRRVNRLYARSDQDQVNFPDAFPFLLISEASLEDLNRRMETPLPMNRFRPNIVVTGTESYAEDQWQSIRIGDIEFAVAKSCVRCTVTTTDQATGERGDEPLRTLATYRRVPGQGVMFGQNLIHLAQGTIRVGDEVSLVSGE